MIFFKCCGLLRIYTWTLWKALNTGAQFYIFFLFAASWWSALEWYVKGLRGAWFRRRSPPRAAADIAPRDAAPSSAAAAPHTVFALRSLLEHRASAKMKVQPKVLVPKSEQQSKSLYISPALRLDQCRILWSRDCGAIRELNCMTN